MKDFKYVLVISIVAFLIGESSSRFSATNIFRTANRIPASRSALVGREKPVKDLPAAQSNAPALAPAEVARDNSDLSEGSVEEYRGDPEGTATQGSGYGDVFDSNGHLLWRFAVLEHDNSHWTILKYFSKPTAKRRNFEPGQTQN